MRIIDTGAQFGFEVGSIFEPWRAAVYAPTGLGHFLRLLDQFTPDLVTFGGGQDVHPHLYNHDNEYGAQVGYNPSKRDILETLLWDHCQQRKIPVLGICRGSQFVCAMSGGALIQDVRGHGLRDTHAIKTHDGREFEITSTHHQMMIPDKAVHELIAWACNLSKGNVNYDSRHLGLILPATWFLKEPEIVFFPKTKALAIQGHPEYLHSYSDTVKYVRNLVSTKLLNGAMDGF